MTVRTCPTCGHKYSFSEYLKKLTFKLIDSNWFCTSCESKITFSLERRIVLAFFGALPFFVAYFILEFFNHIGLSTGLSWFILAITTIVYEIVVYSFDTFTLSKQHN